MIVGIVLVTHGVAGISAAVSLVEWFIGTVSFLQLVFKTHQITFLFCLVFHYDGYSDWACYSESGQI